MGGDRPTGTVTLLFTDVEASTRLVQRLGEEYGEVLARMRRVIRDAASTAGGSLVDARGDETFFVFEDAARAVAAAVSAQHALAAAEWPGGEEVRVRIGVHTGQPSLTRERDYVGVDVHRAVRICNAGHGGQIVLSEQARAALDGVPTVDLGAHRLAGLSEPEHLYQLTVPGLPDAFPPLRAERELEQLRVALADDSVLLREGIARLLGDAGFEVVAQAGDGEALLRAVAETVPDVAIVDIRMPPTHTDEGLQAAARIRAEHPDVAVLVLSQHVEEEYALELLAGNRDGVGYLLKDRVGDVEEFAAAVRRVAAGGLVLDQEVKERLAPAE
jgi:class 3 adenylate cyclase/CheY-like chemotaxis protein